MASSAPEPKAAAAGANANTKTKKPVKCGFCGDRLSEKNDSKDDRVCRACFSYVTQTKCEDCKEPYIFCTCPCRDCGESMDECVCHYAAEPVEPWCTWCDNDPCICAKIAAREAAREDKYDGVVHKKVPSWFVADDYETAHTPRCCCGVILTGFEGWGAYCSRDCANAWADHD